MKHGQSEQEKIENTVRVHRFDSTEEAYDACMCDDSIKTGDVLLIEPEKVIGLAWAWPISLSKATGCLHRCRDEAPEEIMTAGKRVFSDASIQKAWDLIKVKGW